MDIAEVTSPEPDTFGWALTKLLAKLIGPETLTPSVKKKRKDLECDFDFLGLLYFRNNIREDTAE